METGPKMTERKRSRAEELYMARLSAAVAIGMNGAANIREVMSKTGLDRWHAMQAIRSLRRRGELKTSEGRWRVPRHTYVVSDRLVNGEA